MMMTTTMTIFMVFCHDSNNDRDYDDDYDDGDY